MIVCLLPQDFFRLVPIAMTFQDLHYLSCKAADQTHVCPIAVDVPSTIKTHASHKSK